MTSSVLPPGPMQHHFQPPFSSHNDPFLDNLHSKSLLSFPSACEPYMNFEPHTYFNGTSQVLHHAPTDQLAFEPRKKPQVTPQPISHSLQDPQWLFTANTPINLPDYQQRARTEFHVPEPCSPAHHSPTSFRCKWEGCRSPTVFRRVGDLIRHLRTIHILPTAYQCPVKNCGKAFGRKDHLKEHIKGCHRQIEEA
ncbi:hypothetical protein BJX62DRAFT_208794 [Aspergillus germanicus]